MSVAQSQNAWMTVLIARVTNSGTTLIGGAGVVCLSEKNKYTRDSPSTRRTQIIHRSTEKTSIKGTRQICPSHLTPSSTTK